MADVCRLPAELLPRRFVEIGAKLQPDLVQLRRSPDELTLDFRHSPARIRDLADMIVEEAECCSFLRFDLSTDVDNGALRLTIRSPPDARGLLDRFESAARGSA